VVKVAEVEKLLAQQFGDLLAQLAQRQRFSALIRVA
jgi:hypothetical protein